MVQLALIIVALALPLVGLRATGAAALMAWGLAGGLVLGVVVFLFVVWRR